VPDNDTLSRAFSVIAMRPIPVWTALDLVPTATKVKNVKDGGALVYGRETSGANDTGYVYAFKGNSRYEFYRYNTVVKTWDVLESIPALNRNSKKKAVKKGSSLAFGTDGKVYATKGNNTLDFWQYDPETRFWTQRKDVPPGTKNCKEGVSSAAVRADSADYIYLLKGSGTYDFYRYAVATDVWDLTLPAAPSPSTKPYKNGSSIAYDGGDTIFCLKGSYNEFAAYSISGRTWQTRETLPKIAPPNTKKVKAKDGSQLACLGRTIYVLKGNNTNDFWAYEMDERRWHTLEQMPLVLKKVKAGGALTPAPDLAMLFALRGNNTLEFWRYGPLPVFGSLLSIQGAPKDIQSRLADGSPRLSLRVAPNPFSAATRISYSLPRTGNMALRLYDVSGKLAATLAGGHRSAGSYDALMPDGELARGIYLVRLDAGPETAVSKLIIE
jgi:hypothetical protein